MTIDQWLRSSEAKFNKKSILSARLDSLILLEHELGKDRSWLLAHSEIDLSKTQLKNLENLVSRRLKQEPIAYIIGHVMFYGRVFIVNKNVMVPRPESEGIIDILKWLITYPDLAKNNILIADIGTGSGALGITAALELKCSVELIDIDEKALKVAKSNVDKYTIDVKTTLSDLNVIVSSRYDVIIANLPYVPDDYSINDAARYEPAIALFGGIDGLDIYRLLFQQLEICKIKPLYLLLECFPFQQDKLTNIAKKSGYRIIKKVDFIVLYKLSSAH